LGALQITDVIQTLFPELKAVQDIEPIRTIVPEPKARQMNELMSLGWRYSDVVQTQLLASSLDDDEKRCCYRFMHDFSRPSQPASTALPGPEGGSQRFQKLKSYPAATPRDQFDKLGLLASSVNIIETQRNG
jgi:hypothetical protein